MPLKNYQGWALITGASSGLGRAFARCIAAEGVDCLLVGLGTGALAEVEEELVRDHGVACRSLEQDLAAEDAVDRVLAFVGDTPVGLLVNNAGIGAGGAFETRDPARLAQLVKLNCLAPVLLTRALLPPMLARGTGAILFTSSLQAFISCPHEAAYNASKAFLLHFGESLWGELRCTPIDCLTVCPAGMKTGFFRSEGMPQEDCDSMWAVSKPPEAIARLALRKLGRRPLAAPFHTRLTAFLVRFAPRVFTTRVVAFVTARLVNLRRL